jgi:hypothetical protein
LFGKLTKTGKIGLSDQTIKCLIDMWAFHAGPARPVFREVAAEAIDELAAAIRELGSSEGRGPGEVAEDALPLLGGKPGAGRRPLWGAEPGSDEALLVAGAATAASVDPAIVLELHSLWQSNNDGDVYVSGVTRNDPTTNRTRPDDTGLNQPSIIPVVARSESEGDGPPLPTPEVAAAHDAALRSARFGPPPGSRQAAAMAAGATLLGRVVIRLDSLPNQLSGEPFTLRDLPILHYTVRQTPHPAALACFYLKGIVLTNISISPSMVLLILISWTTSILK